MFDLNVKFAQRGQAFPRQHVHIIIAYLDSQHYRPQLELLSLNQPNCISILSCCFGALIFGTPQPPSPSPSSPTVPSQKPL
jgi:hypothetical protein